MRGKWAWCKLVRRLTQLFVNVEGEGTQRVPFPPVGLCVPSGVIYIQALICYTSQAERMLLNTFDVAIIVCVIFNHGCHQILLNLI